MNNILTYGSRYFHFDRPGDHNYTIEEIAHALSQLCRYTGHTRSFYSVAQHSVLVSRKVPNWLAVEGLLHDASEAYLGDVSSPLKRMLPDYRTIERQAERAIIDHFGLYGLDEEWWESVKVVDLRMHGTEKRDLLMHDPDPGMWPDYEPYQEVIRPWSPKKAERKFLERYYEIKDR